MELRCEFQLETGHSPMNQRFKNFGHENQTRNGVHIFNAGLGMTKDAVRDYHEIVCLTGNKRIICQ